MADKNEGDTNNNMIYMDDRRERTKDVQKIDEQNFDQVILIGVNCTCYFDRCHGNNVNSSFSVINLQFIIKTPCYVF